MQDVHSKLAVSSDAPTTLVRAYAVVLDITIYIVLRAAATTGRQPMMHVRCTQNFGAGHSMHGEHLPFAFCACRVACGGGVA